MKGFIVGCIVTFCVMHFNLVEKISKRIEVTQAKQKAISWVDEQANKHK